MTDLLGWIIAVTWAVSVTVCLLQCYFTWCAWRRWQHAAMLDVLLAKLCINACLKEHSAAWRAWNQTMGHYEVSVKSVRYPP